MRITRPSPAKVNFFLNVLGKRNDGFHTLETLFHPVEVSDRLSFELVEKVGSVTLRCDTEGVPTDKENLVFKAATAFLRESGVQSGVRIELEKKIPLEAGLGGGSSNAANTLLGCNELFGKPLDQRQLLSIAQSLGSDVPFFLLGRPAIGTGRGEKVDPVPYFESFKNCWIVVVHPGFGVSTAWAYNELQKYPQALNGRPGRLHDLLRLLETGLPANSSLFHNAFEEPVFRKFPILALIKEFFLERGAFASLMSGSGSSLFALLRDDLEAADLEVRFRERFGNHYWIHRSRLPSASMNS